MPLSLPLSQDQIEAAACLYTRFHGWDVSDKALRCLKDAIPGLEPEAVLLKVVAVNALYYTNVMAIARMAEHVSRIVQRTGPDDFTVATVEEVARLPSAPGQKYDRRFPSFASKFAHFFIDEERFPIYDYYAVKMVERHLGKGNRKVDRERPYAAYVENLDTLLRESGVKASMKQLDCYLWVAGQHAEWLRNKQVPISAEMRRLFEKGTEQERDLLKRVVGRAVLW